MDISKNAQGESVCTTVIEIVSIPSYKLLSDNVSEALSKNKADFTHWLKEIYSIATSTSADYTQLEDIACEITWVTSPAINQPYSAEIRLFLVVRNIGADDNSASSVNQALIQSLKVKLVSESFNFKEVGLKDYFYVCNKSNCSYQALVKHESAEATIVPNLPVIYTYGQVSESTSDLSNLSNILSNLPDVVVHIQAIPTSFNALEYQYISSFVQNASLASKGLMTSNMGAVSYSQVDGPLEIYQHYESRSKGPIFEYNIVVCANPDAIRAIYSQLSSQMNGGSHNSVQFDLIDVSPGYFSEKTLAFSPWIVFRHIYDYLANNTQIILGNYKIDNSYRRLPLIMTEVEFVEIFRLPLGSEVLHSGFLINESKIDNRKHRDDVVNSGDLLIGHMRSSYDNMIGININDLTKHVFVAGTPGSGKSSFLIGVLDRIWREYNLPFLVIEPAKTEYRTLINTIPDLQVFTPGKNDISPFIFNPFLPPKNVKLSSYKTVLKTAFSAAVSMTSPLDKIFEEAINNAYSDHRWVDTYTSESGGSIFNIADFIKTFSETFKSIGYVGDASNIGRAGTVRLNSLVNLFDNYFSIPIEDLLSRPTVIELAAIENQEQKSLLIALILLSILSYVNANYPGDGILKNLLLLEEAHVLFDQESNSNSDSNPGYLAQNLVKRILAEARSYGLGMMVADQSPRKVGLDIVALTDVKVIFRIVEGNDKQIISESMGMEDNQTIRLSKLKPGEAFVFFNKLESPEEVIIDDYRKTMSLPVWMSDKELSSRVTYWQNNMENLRPYPECSLISFCNATCDLNRRSLGKDITRRIFNKYVGSNGKINDVQFVIKNLKDLIKGELNKEPFSKELYYCVKVHFWREVEYKLKLNIPKDRINYYISR